MAHRYFVDHLPEPGPTTLDGELAHHLGRVLRSRPGEEVVLGDGRGGTARATIAAVGRDRVELQVAEVHHEAPTAPTVLLAFAPPRQQRGEWLFEHGTEVGVAVFQPLWTQRTRPQGERPERWAKVVRAAAGQCDRAWLPAVKPALEFAAFLQQPGLPAARWLATANAPPLRDQLGASTASSTQAVLLVGPEGGFTADEQAAAAAAGFRPCGLGPHILRTETAALVGAAMLLAAAGGD
ncbi:MAG: RsmE family RNA methyltransferase [Planctomycetota bacterium]|jgi:16S rRNA (uracil1498-N3)-methyltransferase